MIDVLSRSAAAKKKRPTALVFITTDLIIGTSIIKAAKDNNVLIYQARLFESPANSKAGTPNIVIGEPVLLNPDVRVENQALTIIPPLQPRPKPVAFP